jgi:hypothetical protein
MFDVGDARAPLTPARKAPTFHTAEFFAIMGFGDLWHGRDASNASIPAPLVVFMAPRAASFPFRNPRHDANAYLKTSVHHSPGNCGAEQAALERIRR